MKRAAVLLAAVVGLIAFGFSAPASAHRCDPDDPSNCNETPVMPNWRDGNYVPLFDIDRDDEQARSDAQRWRDECDGQQQCLWVEGGQSLFENRDGSDPSPNEVHAGYAASHCFLAEAAHQCEDHSTTNPEGTHDAHGGAAYADVCLTPNPENKWCDDGLSDTQVGVTIMDHNPCGTIVPIVACTDEYHVVRPFDSDFTAWQMEQSAEYSQRIVADPELYLCGYRQYRSPSHPICPATGTGIWPSAPAAGVGMGAISTTVARLMAI